MKPLLFPFTVLSAHLAEALADGFGVPTVLAAPSRLHLPETVRALGDEGLVEVMFPAGDDERLVGILEQYREWARLHPSDGLLHLAATLDAVPYYDETKPSRIRSEVLGKRHDIPPSETDALTAARVFLLLAQEADEHAEEVEKGLDRLEGQQRTLTQAMLGPEYQPPPASDDGMRIEPLDPALHQTRQRIQAWSRLALQASDPPPLWVTQSRAAFDEVLETAPSSTAVIAQMPFPAAGAAAVSPRDSLWERLARQDCTGTRIEDLHESSDTVLDAPFRLVAALIPDMPPVGLLHRLAGLPEAGVADLRGRMPWRNTLVTCVTSES